jgi:hypothetical protein
MAVTLHLPDGSQMQVEPNQPIILMGPNGVGICSNTVDEWVDSLLAAKRLAAQLAQADITAEEYQRRANYDFGKIVKQILAGPGHELFIPSLPSAELHFERWQPEQTSAAEHIKLSFQISSEAKAIECSIQLYGGKRPLSK